MFQQSKWHKKDFVRRYDSRGKQKSIGYKPISDQNSHGQFKENEEEIYLQRRLLEPKTYLSTI